MLVDLDTFTSDANSLTMEVSDFVLPGGVDAMDDGDQGDLIGRINDQRNDLLKEVDDQIAKTQKVKNTLNGIKSIILGNIADNQTELGTLGNSLQDAAKRNLLNQAIYYEQTSVIICNALVSQLNGQIQFLNDFKVKINNAFDGIVNDIKVMNVAADPDQDYFAWYFSDAASFD